jgi:hypothetical protein
LSPKIFALLNADANLLLVVILTVPVMRIARDMTQSHGGRVARLIIALVKIINKLEIQNNKGD